MRFQLTGLLAVVVLSAHGQVPTFRYAVGSNTYTLGGADPAKGATTTIPTIVVPLALQFEANQTALDAARDTADLVKSPVFAAFEFAGGAPTQYIDAMLRTTFPKASEWHTLLGKPEIKPLQVTIPAGYGYVLKSRRSGRSIAIADAVYLQREVFKQIPTQDGKLIIVVARNTAFYALGDATVCCSWGTHGVDSGTGNSFVLASYLRDTPDVVTDADVQPVTQQLAQFFKDPLHDPLARAGRNVRVPGNSFTGWLRRTSVPPGDAGICAGTGGASQYFNLEPTNRNPKNNIPSSAAFTAHTRRGTWHLQNVALLPWYTGPTDDFGAQFSFPDRNALPAKSEPCPERRFSAPSKPAVAAAPAAGTPNGHWLIGYWAGYGGPGSTFPLREVSPQWDVIIVAFATPDKNAPEGTMQFRTPAGLDTEQFKSDITYLKGQGKKVMISLGGGGQHFTLENPQCVPNFVSSVTRIVSEYGFDGIDIDFESPSLSVAPGDTDYRNPTTPSILNLIRAIREVRDHFGPKFMLSLVPEGTQIPSGYPSYGGQFGSYLPITHALRDILSFIDVQDYNTPPLQGLDGEIYQPGTVDYHAAMTELLLRGFAVGGNSKHIFEPVPANKVAVGFLNGDTTPSIVSQAMQYLITGKAPEGVRYKLRNPAGYPGLLGAMFWTIDADRRANYNYSNVVGPQLHGYPNAH